MQDKNVVMYLCWIGIVAFIPMGNVFGEEQKSLFKLSLEELLAVKVVSASKLIQESSQAPSVISVFDDSQIEQYDWNTINDVLYRMPGFGPSQDYDRPTVATRGNIDSWSNNHILHLIDGIPFNDNLYGSAYTWLMPLFTTNTLEVIRGPGSALYGSNATNGVVQMNTYKAADLKGLSHAKIALGENNSRHVELMSGMVDGSYDFIFAFYQNSTDGNEYLSFDGSNRLATLNDPETSRPLLNKFSTRDEKGDSYLWSKLSIGDNWNIQYHHQQWEFDTGHGWLFWIPDVDEKMKESRDILSLKYSNDDSSMFNYEYALRYQDHDIQWNQRYYPNGAFDGFYPAGVWEFLDTDAQDIFVRAQLTYFEPDGDRSWLVGFEGNYFRYNGDNEHFSNIDIDQTQAPFPDGLSQPVGPWLDFILNEPVVNTALFGQLTNNSFLSDKLALTLGGRFDRLALDYQDIYNDNRPESKSLSRFSPRVALVYNMDDSLVYKLMAGKAFRAPQPTELAGAHTFSLASNIEQLQPELLTTFELAVDWNIDNEHLFRGNLYVTEFENQIAFSTVNFNLSTNVYSTENAGVELEFIGNYDNFSWFANFSYTRRLDETVLAFFVDQDNPEQPGVAEFTEHSKDLKWEPGVKFNAGLSYQADNFQLSLTSHYQGKVERRDNELGNPGGFLPFGVTVPDNFNLNDHRAKTVGSWFSTDLHSSYQISQNLKLGINIRNLFNASGDLIKTGSFPFDYQINDRLTSLYLQANF